MLNMKDKLREKKLKITPQRLEVIRALQSPVSHPSAESIYKKVKKRYPSVSLATVYKTLDTLVQIGEIQVALVSHGRTLYDTRLDDHHHFVCTRCGYVEDVDIKLSCLEHCTPGAVGEHHQVHYSRVVFHGICRDCRGTEGT
jgi:Fur family peroxide stress response transcriptional regulator